MRTLSSGTHCFAIYRFTPIPMTILNSFLLPLPSPPQRAAGMQKKLPSISSVFPPKRKSVPRTCAGFLLHFLSRRCKHFAVCIYNCEENEGFQREHPFDAGFPIGARSIPVGTRFCFAKSSVLYLCFRLTRERG